MSTATRHISFCSIICANVKHQNSSAPSTMSLGVALEGTTADGHTLHKLQTFINQQPHTYAYLSSHSINDGRLTVHSAQQRIGQWLDSKHVDEYVLYLCGHGNKYGLQLFDSMLTYAGLVHFINLKPRMVTIIIDSCQSAGIAEAFRAYQQQNNNRFVATSYVFCSSQNTEDSCENGTKGGNYTSWALGDHNKNAWKKYFAEQKIDKNLKIHSFDNIVMNSDGQTYLEKQTSAFFAFEGPSSKLKHQFTLRSDSDQTYVCDICLKAGDSWGGEAMYGCSGCDYDICIGCMKDCGSAIFSHQNVLFRSKNDAIKLPKIQYFEGNHPRSVTFWAAFHPSEVDQTQCLIAMGSKNGNEAFDQFNVVLYSPNDESAYYFGVMGGKYNGMVKLNANITEFNHFGITYDSIYLKIYVNGEFVFRKQMTEFNTICTNNCVGMKFNGKMSELRFFDYALNQNKINQIYLVQCKNKNRVVSFH